MAFKRFKMHKKYFQYLSNLSGLIPVLSAHDGTERGVSCANKTQELIKIICEDLETIYEERSKKKPLSAFPNDQKGKIKATFDDLFLYVKDNKNITGSHVNDMLKTGDIYFEEYLRNRDLIANSLCEDEQGAYILLATFIDMKEALS